MDRSSSGTLFQNSLWMLLGQGASLLAQALYFVVIARLLGTIQYGIFVGAAASVSIVSQYGSLGSGLLFLRYVSPNRERFSEYWGNILLSTLTFGSLLVVGLSLVCPLFLRGVDARIIVLLAIGDCLCGQLTSSIGQVFQAFEQLKFTAVLNLLTNVTRSLLALELLIHFQRADALKWAMASLGLSVATTVASVILLTCRFGFPTFCVRLFLSRAREGFVFAVSGSTTSVYNDVDKAMLAHFGMNAANAIYTMAYRVLDIATMPIRSLHAAAFPRFFREGASAGGLAASSCFAKKLLSRSWFVALGISATLFVVAPMIPLVIGRSFLPSVNALRWLCVIPVFRACHLSAGDALAGAGRQPVRLAFQTVAAAGNVLLNLALIPRFGWRGAAWASLATDGVLAVLLWTTVLFLVRRDRRSVQRAERLNTGIRLEEVSGLRSAL